MVYISCPKCGKEAWCPVPPLEITDDLQIKPVKLPKKKIKFYCKCVHKTT